MSSCGQHSALKSRQAGLQHSLEDSETIECISQLAVDAAYYGLPTGWIGREVNVQWDELYVRILDPQNGLLLREHVRQKRGWYRIQKEDRPQHMPLQVPSYCGEPDEPVLTSVRSAALFIASSEKPAFVTSWACSRWPRSSVPQRLRTPPVENCPLT